MRVAFTLLVGVSEWYSMVSYYPQALLCTVNATPIDNGLQAVTIAEETEGYTSTRLNTCL